MYVRDQLAGRGGGGNKLANRHILFVSLSKVSRFY